MRAQLFSSRSDEWATPQFLFDALDAEFGFTLDPCATHQNAKCKRFYTKADNGLTQNWNDEVVFMNPPYGRQIGAWRKKAYESSLSGALVVCLLPARTDTNWWHKYAMRGEVRFFKGRLKFGNSQNSAPFLSAIVILRPQHGRVYIPLDSTLSFIRGGYNV
jgi:phage N-6-adenine-methyltransferase